MHIALVRATIAAADGAERHVAEQCTARISRWLADAGVGHQVLDDTDVSRGRLAGMRVAVLCFNPHLHHAELDALHRFVADGGKLIVFYSSDPVLAALVGVRLGRYAAGGDWAAFRFAPTAPPNMPPRVEQRSGNILPVYPADSTARVIAFWEDTAGRQLQEPAWVLTSRGLWMTHILLDDAPAAKQQMLLALLGAWLPEVWQQAAQRRLGTVSRVGAFTSRADAREQIGRQATGAPQENEVRALLAQAANLEERIRGESGPGGYAEVLRDADQEESLLAEGYARAQQPQPNEFRGVWNHSGTGLYPDDWGRTCRLLRQSGMTAVFPNVQRVGTAHYRSQILPASRELRDHGDQLALCTAAARLHGLQVHAWIICWNLEGADPGMLRRLRSQGRLQVSAAGEPLDWLCPSHPENLAYELDGIREIARNYPVDGIHLDYIRFKSTEYCFCAGCRSRFQHDTGLRIRQWPRDVRPGGRLAPAWREWRRGLITRLVSQARQEMRRVAPGAKLSAAVYRSYPGIRESIAQDWGTWLAKGYVDFVCPMDYTEDRVKFEELIRSQLALPAARAQVYPGIGVSSLESRLDATETIRQILACRGAGTSGFMLFDLNSTLEQETLPLLRLGVTAEP